MNDAFNIVDIAE